MIQMLINFYFLKNNKNDIFTFWLKNEREREREICTLVGKKAQNKVFRGKLSLHTVLHTILHVIIVKLCFGNTILVIITKW